ncbi:hypothetical protein [Glycomyces paridis]|uniref:Uncharacterized protein n=1 Tax=Glycomyces paridis TaxID=2126555 RepID=A0A4S8PF75_9ACTN|nr:hypothetical protein [Glycomyces paridis]THV26979.1 hypothetical protein E9998_15960 [Glycomyces paridis]
MGHVDIPEDYEDRLREGRRAADRLPEGPARDTASAALAAAPSREDHARAAALAAEASALTGALAEAAFDGTDAGRVAWLRLDFTGRLRELSLSPTIDRLSNKAVADAIEAAWTAAEAARSEHVLRLERDRAALLAGRVPDPLGDAIRDRVARSTAERFAHVTDDDLCAAEVNLEGRLVELKFLVPNATVDTDCEALAETAAAVIALVQARAAERMSEVVASCLG